MNIYTLSMFKVGKMIEKLRIGGLGKFTIQEILLGHYKLYSIAFFGHKGTPYQKRKVKELNWFVENFDLL